MTEEQYQTLSPYIYFTAEDTIRKATSLLTLQQTPKDSIYKYPAGTVLNLNHADTTELKKIPGVGSGIARSIVNYRQRLGGFHRIEQLQEIHLDYRQLQAWFTVTPSEIRRINLNRVGIERLRNHPYINFLPGKSPCGIPQKERNASTTSNHLPSTKNLPKAIWSGLATMFVLNNEETDSYSLQTSPSFR